MFRSIKKQVIFREKNIEKKIETIKETVPVIKNYLEDKFNNNLDWVNYDKEQATLVVKTRNQVLASEIRLNSETIKKELSKGGVTCKEIIVT